MPQVHVCTVLVGNVRATDASGSRLRRSGGKRTPTWCLTRLRGLKGNRMDIETDPQLAALGFERSVGVMFIQKRR
jgi:hypothetical protein